MSASVLTFDEEPHILCISRDISDLKEAEEALIKSESTLRGVFEAAPMGIGMILPGRLIAWVNEELIRMLGYPEVELVGQNARFLYDSDEEYERVASINHPDVEKYGRGLVETRIKRKDGQMLDILLGSASIDPKDSSLGMVFTVIDITVRKLNEEAVRESEEKLNAIIESIGDAIVIIDREYTVTWCNKNAERVFGKIIGTKCHKTFMQQEEMCDICHVRELFSGGGIRNVLRERYGRDGRKRNFMLTASPMRGPDGEIHAVVETFKDITYQMEVEEAILISERKYRYLFESNPLPMMIFDKNTLAFLDVNEAALKQYGYKREEFLKLTSRDIRPENDAQKFKKVLSKTPPGLYLGGIWKHKKKDGTIIEAEIISHELLYMGRQARLALAIDQTARLKAEAGRREMEERYASFIENFRGIVFRGTVDLQPVFFHGAVEEITGYTAEELCGGGIFWTDVIFTEDLENLRGSLETAKAKGVQVESNYRIRRKDGEIRWIKQIFNILYDVDGRPEFGQGIMYDNTEAVGMQEALTRSSQLAAVGQVASGIAHEINNPLSTISACAEALLSRLSRTGEGQFEHHAIFKDYLGMVLDEVGRSSGIIGDLLDLARVRPLIYKEVDLCELINSTNRLFNIQRKYENIVFQFQGDGSGCKVLGDWDRLRQVVLILLNNAVEAMPDGGELSTSCGLCDDERHAFFNVTDQGPGIEQVHIERVFEPFFSTKLGSRGSGLGLSIADQIISRHGGRIEVSSTPGSGSSFTVILPLAGSFNPEDIEVES